MEKLFLHATSKSPEETEAQGRLLAEKIESLPEYGESFIFVALYGDLGAGKTAFVRGLASVIAPGAHVSSPTYAIVNEYRGLRASLVHFDFYRIESEDELYSIGFDDYFTPGVVIAAEWCERIPFALPRRRFDVKIAGSGGSPREIEVFAIGYYVFPTQH